jgi:hypothetical protein
MPEKAMPTSDLAGPCQELGFQAGVAEYSRYQWPVLLKRAPKPLCHFTRAHFESFGWTPYTHCPCSGWHPTPGFTENVPSKPQTTSNRLVIFVAMRSGSRLISTLFLCYDYLLKVTTGSWSIYLSVADPEPKVLNQRNTPPTRPEHHLVPEAFGLSTGRQKGKIPAAFFNLSYSCHGLVVPPPDLVFRVCTNYTRTTSI